MWIRPRTSGVPSIAARISCWCSVVADSPISRLFISTTRITAMATSRIPIARVAAPSQAASPVTSVSVRPTRANSSPTSAPRSSSSTTGSSGLFERRM